MKKFLRDYFTFNKRERRGVIFLIVLLIIALIARWAIPRLITPAGPEVTITLLDWAKQKGNAANDSISLQPFLSTFNPDTTTAEQWEQMGVSSIVAERIEKFTSRGGRIRTVADLQKMYGIDTSVARQIAEFIQAPAVAPRKMTEWKKFEKYPPREFPAKPFKTEKIVDLNSADSAEVETLPGIGPTLTMRIIRYRDALGGFVSPDQLKEVYGLMRDTAVFEKLLSRIHIDPSSVKKLNINTATYEQLKKHPYLSPPIAGAIVNYRKKHGAYKSVSDLSSTGALDAVRIKRIEPYLETGSE